MAKSGWKVSGTITRRALLAASLAGLAFAQDSGVIRVDVRLVRILATVKDRAGALVGTLNKSDFSIADNGAPQEVAVFERQTDQPLSVGLLIDTSGSTKKDLPYETDSVLRFLRALFKEGNPSDSAALYSFNWEVVKQTAFMRNLPDFDRALRQLRGEAGTSLYDAILLASRDMERRPGRKVLVIVTDGGDTVSKTDFQKAAEAAQLADAVIYPILVMPIINDAGRNVGGENALATFATRSGGKVFSPAPGRELDAAFDTILKDLRTQYLLGFYPKDVPLTADRFHSLTVGVSDPSMRVSARSGYYGEAIATAPPVSAAPTGSDQTVRRPKPPTKKQ